MADIELLQGTLDMMVLKTLTLEPLHGYAVARRIRQASGDVLMVEEGSLYPALYRLEERRLVASEWGVSETNRRAKFYRLTKAGRKELDAAAGHWTMVSIAVSRVMQGA
jgi:PadR family transcriptional regulator PadR